MVFSENDENQAPAPITSNTKLVGVTTADYPRQTEVSQKVTDPATEDKSSRTVNGKSLPVPAALGKKVRTEDPQELPAHYPGRETFLVEGTEKSTGTPPYNKPQLGRKVRTQDPQVLPDCYLGRETYICKNDSSVSSMSPLKSNRYNCWKETDTVVVVEEVQTTEYVEETVDYFVEYESAGSSVCYSGGSGARIVSSREAVTVGSSNTLHRSATGERKFLCNETILKEELSRHTSTEEASVEHSQSESLVFSTPKKRPSLSQSQQFVAECKEAVSHQPVESSPAANRLSELFDKDKTPVPTRAGSAGLVGSNQDTPRYADLPGSARRDTFSKLRSPQFSNTPVIASPKSRTSHLSPESGAQCRQRLQYPDKSASTGHSPPDLGEAPLQRQGTYTKLNSTEGHDSEQRDELADLGDLPYTTSTEGGVRRRRDPKKLSAISERFVLFLFM